MNGCDILVFTGGVGENSVVERNNICADLDWLGIEIENDLNSKAFGVDAVISKESSRVKSDGCSYR